MPNDDLSVLYIRSPEGQVYEIKKKNYVSNRRA